MQALIHWNDVSMKNFVEIATFTLPHELAVARTLLESYEIECVVKDELTIQVHNFYSNAIGGIALNVPQEDIQQAEKLLNEHGFEAYLALPSEATIASEIEFSESQRYKVLKLAIKIVVVAAALLVIAVLFLIHFVK